MKGIVVKQEDEADCGSACLASIIKYYKGYVPLEIIKYDTMTDSSGTNFYYIKMAAKKYGFNVVGYNSDYDIVPFISQVIVNGIKHFIVVYKICDSYVLCMDPAYGIRKYSITYYKEISTGNYLKLFPIGKIAKYKHNSLLSSYYKNIIFNNFKDFILLFFVSFLIIIINFFHIYYLNKVLYFKYLSIIIVLILIFRIILNFFKNLYVNKLTKVINESLINDYIVKWFSVPYKYIYLKSSGNIINRINDLNYIKDFFSREIINIFLNLFIMIICFIILFYLSSLLSIIIICLIILLVLYLKRINRYLLIKFNNNSNSNNDYFDMVTEYSKKIISIYNLNIGTYLIDKLSSASKVVSLNNYEINRLENYYNLGIDIFNSLILIIIFIFLIKYDYSNIVYYYLIYDIFKDSLIYLLSVFSISNMLKDMIYRINGLSYLDCSNYNSDVSFVFDSIKFKNLSYSFANKIIINDFNYNIKVGSKILVKGENGSGKSTLMNLLYRNIEDYEGTIMIGNVNIKDIDITSYRCKVVYVSQGMDLFNDSIINNIILNKTLDVSKIKFINKILNISSFIDVEKEIYSFMYNNNLSGGQKQKIVLARALYNDFDILILDEAFSEISFNERLSIINKMNDIFNDKTIIYINHFDDDIKYDDIVRL